MSHMHWPEYVGLQYPLNNNSTNTLWWPQLIQGLDGSVRSSCTVPAYAARCVRPLLGGEGAGEGEPTSVYRSPARENEEAVENEKRDQEEESL